MSLTDEMEIMNSEERNELRLDEIKAGEPC